MLFFNRFLFLVDGKYCISAQNKENISKGNLHWYWSDGCITWKCNVISIFPSHLECFGPLPSITSAIKLSINEEMPCAMDKSFLKEIKIYILPVLILLIFHKCMPQVVKEVWKMFKGKDENFIHHLVMKWGGKWDFFGRICNVQRASFEKLFNPYLYCLQIATLWITALDEYTTISRPQDTQVHHESISKYITLGQL